MPCGIAFEGAAESRTDRHAASRAEAAFEETGWESESRPDLAVQEHVIDGQRQHLRNPETEKHLSAIEDAVAHVDATDVPNKTPFFTRREETGAGEAGWLVRFE